jgi:hypothetical protein
VSEQEIDTAAIRLRHYAFRGNCMGCTRSYGGYHDYPCETIRLADALDAARAALEDRTEAWVAELHRHGETQAHLATALRAARAEGEAP